MKHFIFSTVLILAFSGISFAQQSVNLSTNSTKIILKENKENSITFSNHIQDIKLSEVKTKGGVFAKIDINSYSNSQNIGCPDLPSIKKIIEVPYNAIINVNIISYEEQTINLDELGIRQKIQPEQATVSKSQDPNSIEFAMIEKYYNGVSTFTPEAVKVELLSKMRGVQLALLSVNPFEYDAESNTLSIKNNMQVEIEFQNADIMAYENAKNKYYSPVFQNAFDKIWNYKEPSSKSELARYPIKYVIVSHPMFEETLQAFIEWKTKKGFYVIEAYTDDPAVGNTVASIKSYLKNLYENATALDPAPTYALFVGDVAQVPTTNTGQHVSDLYTVEFDGGSDYIPEMYFGRFSATTIEHLEAQIEKTLMHEQYTYPDPSFLEEVVLVAGADATWAPTHANGQIGYATQYYFNSEHNMSVNEYLYPESSSANSEIRTKVNNGASFVVYTAHCTEDGWGDPAFTRNHARAMTNENEYFFGVGNCCLANKFEVDECFGEVLVRTPKKGAVVHIGGTNSTYWDEDYYWTVGVTNTINTNQTYETTTQAAYDHLFHERGETPYVSAYEMAFIGNMSVMESGSSRTKYYWEIYSVLGDPSVMTYAGIPTEIEVNHITTTILGINQLTVTTEPDAYVAISMNGVLLDAKLADANGIATLEFEPINNLGYADIVVTKQFRQAYFGTCMIIPGGNDYDAMLSSIILPATSTHITNASMSPKIEIMNLGEIELTNVAVLYQIDNQEIVEKNWTGSLAFLGAEVVEFDEITLTEGEHTITAWVSNPNGEVDQYSDNDSRSKQFLVYSGNVKLISIEAPIASYCNENMVKPEIIVKNMDSNPLTSLTCSYSINNGEMENEILWEGNIEAYESINIEFPSVEMPNGENTIVFTISDPNGGSDLNMSDNQASTHFNINNPGIEVQFYLKTDYYGSETSWELVSDASSNVLYEGGPYQDGAQETNNYIWCLSDGCYTFTIYDTGGNGLQGILSLFYKGEFKITNLSTNEIYINYDGSSSFSELSQNFCITTNTIVENEIGTKINIYPNPSNGILNIDSKSIINNVSLINSLGQIIFTKKIDSSSTSINTSDYEVGIYFLQIETTEGIGIKRVSILR